MSRNPASEFGDFTLFGFSQDPAKTVLNKLLLLGITPQIVDFGPASNLFFYTTYGDVVETADLIVLKLGFARTPDVTPLAMCIASSPANTYIGKRSVWLSTKSKTFDSRITCQNSTKLTLIHLPQKSRRTQHLVADEIGQKLEIVYNSHLIEKTGYM